MQKNQGHSRIHRIASYALCAFMLAACAGMAIMTIAPNFNTLFHSLYYLTKLSPYLPEDRAPNALEMLAARVRSFDSELGSSVYLADELGQINASAQYALGKRLVSTGSAQMVRLNGGYLYDLQEEQSMQSAAEEILDLQAMLPADIPFLFVYEHPTVYDAAMLPDGYDVLDYGEEAADEVVGLLRDGGTHLIDSRDVLTASKYPLQDFLMRTDQHWTTFAALVMAGEIAAYGNETLGLPLDATLLDPEQFDSETIPALFLGKYGQRIGVQNVRPDDISVFWPKYDTQIVRHSEKTKSQEDVSGDFKTAAIRWERLEPDEGGWNTVAYLDYGLTEKFEHFSNPDAPECTILLFKDSYSAPIGAFLSLVARDVYAVDLRQSDMGAPDYVEMYHPDLILMSYSQQMLRDRQYEFVN